MLRTLPSTSSDLPLGASADLSGGQSRGSRSRIAVRVVVLAILVAPPPAAAQDLPLKRTVPGEELARCNGEVPPEASDEEERSQAASLGSSAAQAVILGDRERARELLGRAVQLDPRSPDLAYQYGRILEELGETEAARDRYCIVLAVAPDGPDAGDVRARLAALATAVREGIPDGAVEAFRQGITRADEGRWDVALQWFDEAVAEAPRWPAAVYDRGVAHARLGRDGEAAADFRTYLTLEPGASDAILVSERIGQLVDAGRAPSAGAALALGMLFPGMGQIYTGRTGFGLATLAVAGGAAAAALLIRDVDVRCLDVPPPGEECPPGRILDENEERPYLVPGLAVAGGVMLATAVEAFIHARRRTGSPGDAMSLGRVGPVDLAGPAVSADGDRLRIRVLRVGF